MYQDESELLQARVTRLEAENKQLKNMMLFIIDTLKKIKNIDLDIDDNIITLRDRTGKLVRTRLPESS